MSRDKPTQQHDPKRDTKPSNELPDAPSTKPSTPSGKPDQGLPPAPDAGLPKPPPGTADNTLPAAPDQSLPPEKPGQPTQPLPINPDNGLPEVPPGAVTLPVPPGTPTDPVTGEPLPQPPPTGIDNTLPTPPAVIDNELPDPTKPADDTKTFVLQAEHKESASLVWLDVPGAFPTEEDAQAHLKGLAVEEKKTLDARISAGSQGGETGRFRIVVRTTTERVITAVDLIHDPVEPEPEPEPK